MCVEFWPGDSTPSQRLTSPKSSRSISNQTPLKVFACFFLSTFPAAFKMTKGSCSWGQHFHFFQRKGNLQTCHCHNMGFALVGGTPGREQHWNLSGPSGLTSEFHHTKRHQGSKWCFAPAGSVFYPVAPVALRESDSSFYLQCGNKNNNEMILFTFHPGLCLLLGVPVQ